VPEEFQTDVVELIPVKALPLPINVVASIVPETFKLSVILTVPTTTRVCSGLAVPIPTLPSESTNILTILLVLMLKVVEFINKAPSNLNSSKPKILMEYAIETNKINISPDNKMIFFILVCN
jgi:hypothetical protein